MSLDSVQWYQYADLLSGKVRDYPVTEQGDFAKIHSFLSELSRHYSRSETSRLQGKAVQFFSNFGKAPQKTFSSEYRVSERLRYRMESIEECLASPDLYGVKSTDIKEYRSMLLTIIASAKDNILGMSETDRQKEIIKEREKQEQIEKQNRLFAMHKPPMPGEDRSTVSLEKSVAQKAIGFFKKGKSVNEVRLIILEDLKESLPFPHIEIVEALRGELIEVGLYRGEEQGEALVMKLIGVKPATSSQAIEEFRQAGVPPELLLEGSQAL
jgi:hypothetical protein